MRFVGAGHRKQAGLALHQQVVGLLRCVRTGRSVAGNTAPDEPGMACAQLRGAESKPVRGARREVLHEDVGTLDEPRQDLLRVAMLYIERETFLRAIDPDEMRGEPVDGVIVMPRRIAGVGPLD